MPFLWKKYRKNIIRICKIAHFTILICLKTKLNQKIIIPRNDLNYDLKKLKPQILLIIYK